MQYTLNKFQGQKEWTRGENGIALIGHTSEILIRNKSDILFSARWPSLELVLTSYDYDWVMGYSWPLDLLHVYQSIIITCFACL